MVEECRETRIHGLVHDQYAGRSRLSGLNAHRLGWKAMPFALDDLDSNCNRLDRNQAAEVKTLADLCEHGGICVGRHVDCIYRAEAAASHIEVRAVRNCQRSLVGCAAAGDDGAAGEDRIEGVGRGWNGLLQLGIACQVVLTATSVSLPESIPSPRSPSRRFHLQLATHLYPYGSCLIDYIYPISGLVNSCLTVHPTSFRHNYALAVDQPRQEGAPHSRPFHPSL